MAQVQDGVETVEPEEDKHDVGGAQPSAAEAAEASQAAGEEGEDEEADEEAPIVAFEPSDPAMLLGEMRDDVLAGLKGPVGWSKLKEVQQVFIANAVEQACRRVIRGAVRIAATMELDAIEVTIKDPGLKSDKDVIEAKIIMADDEGAWANLRLHSKRLLVFANADALMNARAAAVMKDQPGLFGDGTETPAAKAKRERIDSDAAEREASERRARQFKPLDEPPTIDNDTGAVVTPAPAPVLLLGSMLSPEVKAATDRGVAHRQAGGTRAIPKDLEGKAGEANAWLKGYDTADVTASGRTVDEATGEVYHGGAKPPARAPRGHRSKRAPAEADA